MFSVPYIVAAFYHGKSLEERQQLVDFCVVNGVEYYEVTWKEVTKADLLKKEVQCNLVKTLFQSQWGYWGVISEIIRKLDGWVGEMITTGVDQWPAGILEFYQRYYAFVGFLHFARLDRPTQIKLLHTNSLPLACLWDIPVYYTVQDHFANLAYVSKIRTDVALFTECIAKNPTPVGDEGRARYTIEKWVKLFDDFFGSSYANRVDEFFIDKAETVRLSKESALVLQKILTLYYGLKSGFIWREIQDIVPPGLEWETNKEGKGADDYYLELLSHGGKKEIGRWLADWETVGRWILETNKERNFMNRLFYVITQKVDLADEAQVGNLVKLLDGLYQMDWALGADLLYFNEQDGKFFWNKDIVDALQQEIEELDRQKKDASTRTNTVTAVSG